MLKHADARHVVVRLQRGAHQLELHIDDDGCGLNRQPLVNGSRGIDNMRSRAKRLGGRLDVVSSADAAHVALTVSLAVAA